MLGSGLALYLPSLSNVVARPTAKAWHLWSAAVLGIGIVALVVLGNRRALARTARDLDRLDRDDARWLAGGPGRLVTGDRPPPQGRFNAGQKLNAAITLGLMVVMAVTGLLLWYGEQDTAYRYAGTVYVHDWGAWILIVLVDRPHLPRGAAPGDATRAPRHDRRRRRPTVGGGAPREVGGRRRPTRARRGRACRETRRCPPAPAVRPRCEPSRRG